MNGKKYGSQNTNLVLTKKADEFYGETDPLNIFEYNDGTYKTTGFINATFKNADELNKSLEDMADSISENN
jgi:topoisomerase IA-like protein